MKKCLSIVFVIALFGNIFSTEFTPASGYSYEWQLNRTIQAGQYMDTLSGASDSSTLASYYAFEPGWVYIFRRGAITGGGSDSVKLQLVVDAYNSSKAFMQRVVVDSLTAAAGEQIQLPIYTSLYGSYFTIKVKAYTDNGGHVILNNLYLDRVRIYK